MCGRNTHEETAEKGKKEESIFCINFNLPDLQYSHLAKYSLSSYLDIKQTILLLHFLLSHLNVYVIADNFKLPYSTPSMNFRYIVYLLLFTTTCSSSQQDLSSN